MQWWDAGRYPEHRAGACSSSLSLFALQIGDTHKVPQPLMVICAPSGTTASRTSW